MQTYAFRRLLKGSPLLDGWRRLGMTVGEGARIEPSVRVRSPENVTIGDRSVIQGGGTLDAWTTISIGKNVILNDGVALLAGSHDVNSPTFDGVRKPILVGDYAWLTRNVVVLPGVTVGDRAVVGVNSVVTRDVEPRQIVAGNPAVPIGQRADVDYVYVP